MLASWLQYLQLADTSQHAAGMQTLSNTCICLHLLMHWVWVEQLNHGTSRIRLLTRPKIAQTNVTLISRGDPCL